jgi:hypothetical protein
LRQVFGEKLRQDRDSGCGKEGNVI